MAQGKLSLAFSKLDEAASLFHKRAAWLENAEWRVLAPIFEIPISSSEGASAATSLEALGGVIGAAGLTHPGELQPHHLFIRCQDGAVRRGDEVFPLLESGELVDESAQSDYAMQWQMASASSFDATAL